jgi:hypothetical protein
MLAIQLQIAQRTQESTAKTTGHGGAPLRMIKATCFARIDNGFADGSRHDGSCECGEDFDFHIAIAGGAFAQGAQLRGIRGPGGAAIGAT